MTSRSWMAHSVSGRRNRTFLIHGILYERANGRSINGTGPVRYSVRCCCDSCRFVLFEIEVDVDTYSAAAE